MGRTKLDIILEAPENAVFLSGSKLRGKVMVEAFKPIAAKQFVLRVYGTEKSFVRYHSMSASMRGPEERALAAAASTITKSYKKSVRAVEVTTTGALAAALGDNDENEVSFFQAITTEFLKHAKDSVVAQVKEELLSELIGEDEELEKITEEMEKYAEAAVSFIKDVKEVVKEAQAENVDLKDVNKRRELYGKAGLVFMKTLFPEQTENALEIYQYAKDFMHVVTGNAHRKKKKRGNAESVQNRIIFDVKIPVDHFGVIVDGFVQKGKHEVPFEVELPDSLPSSINVVETNGSSCRIEYRIMTILKGSGYLWNFKCKRAFKVRAEPMTTESCPYSTGDSTTVRSVGVFKQGAMAYAAKLDDIALDKGETTTVRLAFRNTAKVNIKSIDAILFQECSWGGGWNYIRCCPNPEENMISELQSFNFPLEDGTVTESKGTAVDTMLREMNQDLESGTNLIEVPFSMPKDALASYVGSIYSVKHRLRVTLKTDSKFTTNPVLWIPVICGETQEEAEITIQPQEDSSAEIEELSGMEDVVTVPKAGIEMGGKAQEGDDPDFEEAETHKVKNVTPKLSVLLEKMKCSVRDLSVVEFFLADPEWAPVFGKISAKEFGKIMGEVDYFHEWQKVAVAIAEKNENFTCAHVAAALKKLEGGYSRAELVKQLLPLTSDFAKKQKLIKNELKGWELVVPEPAFAMISN